MARIAWSVDGHRLEYLGRGSMFSPGGLLIDGAKDEECRVKLSRPDYEFWLGKRRLVLKTLGDSSELLTRNLLITPSAKHVAQVPAPGEARCSKHPEAPATIACARCGTFSCSPCEGPDGTHCAACQPGSAESGSHTAAGPAAALRDFGGLVGEAVFVADAQLDRVASPHRARWIRIVLYGSILLGLIALLATLAPGS